MAIKNRSHRRNKFITFRRGVEINDYCIFFRLNLWLGIIRRLHTSMLMRRMWWNISRIPSILSAIHSIQSSYRIIPVVVQCRRFQDLLPIVLRTKKQIISNFMDPRVLYLSRGKSGSQFWARNCFEILVFIF